MKQEANNKKCISRGNNDNNINTEQFMKEFVEILKELRGENGCPWDKEQTHESLKPCLIEEAYEVIDAIDKKNIGSLKEELGDLLLQVVFHANLADEQGWFNLDDVIKNVSKKMIDRHPHVFGNLQANDLNEALHTWEEMKKNEKEVHSHAKVMEDIPNSLPALMKSYKVQKKAADVGFDWATIEGAFDKIKEETTELMEVLDHKDEEKKKDEIGDLLFSVVNASRFLKIDPEDALNGTIRKFINRFDYMETLSKRNNKPLEEMNSEEMDDLWKESKNFF